MGKNAWTREKPRVGQRAERSRLVRREDIALFTEMSGDRNPLHYDEAARDELSTALFDVTDRIASVAWDTAELKALHQGLSDEMKREVAALVALRTEAAGAERKTA